MRLWLYYFNTHTTYTYVEGWERIKKRMNIKLMHACHFGWSLIALTIRVKYQMNRAG